jgi:hypothetical protein
VAVALVVLAAALRIWPLDALGICVAYITYYPAVMGAALYGGAVASAMVTLIVVIWGPNGQGVMSAHSDVLGLAAFLANGVMISIVGEIMQRTRRRWIRCRPTST